jgi:AAA15 family ATPase/GTPase
MISTIRYSNFKCFTSEVNVPTSKINLLAGINGRGKSTVLQGLLLMRQSPEHSRTTDQIIFNGSCVELGSFDDIRSSSVSRTEPIVVSFEFRADKGSARLTYTLRENPTDEMVAQIEKFGIQGLLGDKSFEMELFPRRLIGFCFTRTNGGSCHGETCFLRKSRDGESLSFHT